MRLKFFFFILLISGNLMAQESKPEQQNKERIQQLDKALKTAVNTEDFETAALLKKEETIRKEMAVSFEKKDYERLAELKKELKNCACVVQSKAAQKTTTDVESTLSKSNQAFVEQQKKNKFRNKRFVAYFNFVPFAYIKSKVNKTVVHKFYTNNSSTSETVFQKLANDMEGGGFRFGGVIYFNNMQPDQKIKVGLNIIFASLTAGMDFNNPGDGLIYLSLGCPGITINQYINRKSGINYSFNIGNTILTSTVPNTLALGMVGQISYWYKNFSVGLEYQFINSIDNDDVGGGMDYDVTKAATRLNQFGITCGFHF